MTPMSLMAHLPAILAGLLGVVLLAAGYRLMRLTARLGAAVLLGFVGYLIAGAAFEVKPGATPWLPLLFLGVGAVVGFLVGNLFYYVNVGLNGATAGMLLGAVGYALARTQPSAPWLYIACGIAGGILGILFERPLGVFGTSLMGGMITVSAARSLYAGIPLRRPEDLPLPWLAAAGVLALLGCFIQAHTTKVPVKEAAAAAKPAPGRTS